MALLGGGCSSRNSVGGAIDNDGLGVVVSNHVDRWDLPEVDIPVTPATEDSPFGDSDDGVVVIADVDCLLSMTVM